MSSTKFHYQVTIGKGLVLTRLQDVSNESQRAVVEDRSIILEDEFALIQVDDVGAVVLIVGQDTPVLANDHIAGHVGRS